MAADMTDEQFAEMVKKPRAETPQNTPFTWIVSFTCGNDADYEELLKLFTDYRPKAQALGAKTFDVVKSVKGRTIFVYESYDGPNAAETHHKVHTHPDFMPAHNRIRRIHNAEGNSSSGGFYLTA
ncbi:uncharacterized protein PAC_04725 [Phialocephala subalpina]|uniref:ABM domain-containing protein n=1 Tax=Phialocephala subalpina TaxID=576137 RepID=A0A1L7WQ11_9HELO|nr:uncharacterized protein PAC_04725 [Phialocephala subalpina]